MKRAKLLTPLHELTVQGDMKMSDKELLKSMLNNFINDNQEQASMDLHTYFTGKMQEVSGLAPAQSGSSALETDAELEENSDV